VHQVPANPAPQLYTTGFVRTFPVSIPPAGEQK
jgi:hypothetical protein